MSAPRRFPLPVSRCRAPFIVAWSTGWLALAAAFLAGFCAAVWTIGMIVTAAP